MQIIIKDTYTNKDFLISIHCLVDGSKRNEATATLTGFGDSLHRTEVFNMKKIKEAQKTFTEAQPVIESVQKLADELYERYK